MTNKPKKNNLNKSKTNNSDQEGIELAKKIGTSLCVEQNAADRQVTRKLARLLLHDAALTVRKALVKELRNSQFLPLDLAISIANDLDEVSEPFLLENSIVDSKTLATLARECRESAREIIAKREGLPEEICLIIAELGKEKAVGNLIDNKSAEVTEKVCGTLILRFSNNVNLLDKLAGRPELPIAVIESIIGKISQKMASQLIKSYKLTPEFVTYAKEMANINVMNKVQGIAPENGLLVYFKRLKDENKLTDNMLIQFLKENSINSFQSALSVRSKVELTTVKSILSNGSERKVIGLFDQANISSAARLSLVRLFRNFNQSIKES